MQGVCGTPDIDCTATRISSRPINSAGRIVSLSCSAVSSASRWWHRAEQHYAADGGGERRSIGPA